MSKKVILKLKGATREERFAEIVAYYDMKFEGYPRPFMATAPAKKRKSPPKKRTAAVKVK